MIENKYKFEIQTSDNVKLNIQLTEGKALFVLGANGVGKSTLMHKIYEQNFKYAKRILAHRQTWFQTNSIEITEQAKKQTEANIKSIDCHISSRWKDDFSVLRPSISFFDLINAQNVRARNIADAVDNDEMIAAKLLSNNQSSIQIINELFKISNIPIVITLEKDGIFASKNGSESYSISELSDGERNALLICSDVLTSDINQLIIIDEPERHLHRSIISPLLSSLFLKRKDCVFVVSTHDTFLPLGHPEASILLLRSCQWNGKYIKSWDANFLEEEEDKIPSSIKHEILGSKKNILYVQGEHDTLETQIYSIIYPTVTVIPKGCCIQVEKAVDGIKVSEKLHWLNVYGLIDAKQRNKLQIKILNDKGIAAISCYTVDALYYNLYTVNRVAIEKSRLTGEDVKTLYNKVTSEILDILINEKERLCSRLCEKYIRDYFMTMIPAHKEIQNNETCEIKIDFSKSLKIELQHFDKLVFYQDLDALISRYPISETPVLTKIAKALGMNRKTYESTVRKLIVDDPETKDYFKNTLLEQLTKLIKE